MPSLYLTKLPLLDSIVIRQGDGHYFISTTNSIIIDKAGIVGLIKALISVDFIDVTVLDGIVSEFIERSNSED